KELENKIKEFFGILTANIVKEIEVRNLILTGGDVAISVCKELDISKLNILDELLPGIPLARARIKNRDLNIVTKAGGFGKKDTLYELINKFRNRSRV
ncbi:MAG: nucleotide-binding domain containing protein, partial [Caldisericia bacterium]|nr:nucleotide-binding domain containing protein [Caldisericia bacterium]